MKREFILEFVIREFYVDGGERETERDREKLRLLVDGKKLFVNFFMNKI